MPCGTEAKKQKRGIWCPVCRLTDKELAPSRGKLTINLHLQRAHCLEMLMVCPGCMDTRFYGSRNFNDVSKHMEAKHPDLDPEVAPYWLIPHQPGKLDCRRERCVLMPNTLVECTPEFARFCARWSQGAHVTGAVGGKRPASSSPVDSQRTSPVSRRARDRTVRTVSKAPDSPEMEVGESSSTMVPELLLDESRDQDLDLELGYVPSDSRTVKLVEVKRVVTQPRPAAEPLGAEGGDLPPAIVITSTGDTPPRTRQHSPASTPGSGRRKSGTPKKRLEVNIVPGEDLADWSMQPVIARGLQVTSPAVARQDPPWLSAKGTPSEETYREAVAKDLGCDPLIITHTTNVLSRLEDHHPGGVRRFLEHQGVMDQRPLVVAREEDGDINVRFPHGVMDLVTLGRALRQVEREDRRTRRETGSGSREVSPVPQGPKDSSDTQ